ncbi:hypothetical protein [Macrococcus armenti]|nr:hypothetical protein [Macrococcus armenti]UBH10120.1 hypothetical protein LAU38_07485 [Macrococcus armenti]
MARKKKRDTLEGLPQIMIGCPMMALILIFIFIILWFIFDSIINWIF